MEANRRALAESLSPPSREGSEDFVDVRPWYAPPSSNSAMDLAYASVLSPTDALEVATRVNDLELDMEQIKLEEQLNEELLLHLKQTVSPTIRDHLCDHLRRAKLEAWAWDRIASDYYHVRDTLLPFSTRLALRGYGVGARQVVDRAFYDIIGAHREGVEFLEFRRWLMRLMDDIEGVEMTNRQKITHGDSAVPAEMRDRVRTAFMKRESNRGNVSPTTRNHLRRAMREASVQGSDPMATLFRSLDLGNNQVEDFQRWIEGIFVDFEVVRKPSVSGLYSHEADKQWHTLKQPLFDSGLRHSLQQSASWYSRGESLRSNSKSDECDGTAPWGEPWKPPDQGDIVDEAPGPLMNTIVANQIVGHAASPRRHSYLAPVVLHSLSPERVVVRHSSPPRFGDKVQVSGDTHDADKSRWRRRMAANRQELCELADNLPTRLFTSMGPRMVIEEDPLGLTTVVVDHHHEPSWVRALNLH